jgi:tripartite-type tricarboxylate transporter receptor subunit TctC
MKAIRNLICAAAAVVLTGAWAQTYPAKPITLVNAFPPGGSTDIIARQVIARLNAEITQALADPEIRATFQNQNIEPSPGTPEAFGAWIAAERARWVEVVAKAGIRLE